MSISNDKKQHVFIIGCKGIPATYGGFETFVDKLTYYRKDPRIQYHVSCMVNPVQKKSFVSEFVYNNVRCFNVSITNWGAAKAVLYDLKALGNCLSYIKKNNIPNPIIYVLACRIGPFINNYKMKIKSLKGQLYVNPDGNEWKRDKWNFLIKKYWKISEHFMVKYADLLICDSKNIEKYIEEHYKRYSPNTIYIAYGTDITKSNLKDGDSQILNWFAEKNVEPKNYYLVVGRFIPENNYEIIIREFMKSKTKRNLVLITNLDNNKKYYEQLKISTKFEKDRRIKFAGTIYNQELLKKIRENAYGYLHGHEVGGTNPSLLESLSSTNLNLLLNVKFNKEVAGNSAMYWEKETGQLVETLDKTDIMSIEEIKKLGDKAKKRMHDHYSWDFIVDGYEKLFLK